MFFLFLRKDYAQTARIFFPAVEFASRQNGNHCDGFATIKYRNKKVVCLPDFWSGKHTTYLSAMLS